MPLTSSLQLQRADVLVVLHHSSGVETLTEIKCELVQERNGVSLGGPIVGRLSVNDMAFAGHGRFAISDDEEEMVVKVGRIRIDYLPATHS